jgi:hypothetical protein
MRKLKFVPGMIGLTAGLVWIVLRRHYAPHDNVTVEALVVWWRAQLTYAVSIFVLLAAAFFLPFLRKLRPAVLLSSICNLFMTCTLFAIHTATSDPVLLPQLARIGLGCVPSSMLVLTVIWAVVFFYLFSTEVDRSLRSTHTV